eukprot:55149-Chlamydomonas_euryale.AAC.4
MHACRGAQHRHERKRRAHRSCCLKARRGLMLCGRALTALRQCCTQLAAEWSACHRRSACLRRVRQLLGLCVQAQVSHQ